MFYNEEMRQLINTEVEIEIVDVEGAAIICAGKRIKCADGEINTGWLPVKHIPSKTKFYGRCRYVNTIDTSIEADGEVYVFMTKAIKVNGKCYTEEVVFSEN